MRVAEVIQTYRPGDGLNYAAAKITEALSRIKGVDAKMVFERGNPPVKNAMQMSFAGAIKFIAKNADIAHSHIGTGILKCNFAKLINPRLKHVTTYSVIAPPEFYPPYRKTLLFHKAAYAWGVDLPVGISKYACDDFKRNFGRPAKLIYDGVDVEEFKPAPKAGERFRARHKIAESALVVGYVSRFNRHKNHAALVRAFASLPSDAVLVLGGVGDSGKEDTFEQCRQLAASRGIASRVKFLGFVPQEEMNGFYNAIDVHAFPSLWEGFGLNILEASAAAKPTVAFKLYSVQELVGEKQGNGFAVADEKQFAERLRRLLEDAKLRRKMGGRALSFAHEFSWDKVARRYVQEFKQLLA